MAVLTALTVTLYPQVTGVHQHSGPRFDRANAHVNASGFDLMAGADFVPGTIAVVSADFRACGRNVEAEAALQAETGIDPAFAEAWYNLSDLLDDQGRSEAAIECHAAR